VPAAPVKPPELRAEEKRALREQARREFRAAERERLEAAAKPAAPAAGKATATPGAAPAPADPDRTDAQRAADAAVFLRGFLLPVLSLLAYPFGWRLRVESFTAEQAREDAAAWVPVARRYRWVDLVITWAGVPARLVARVRELAERRAPKESKP
jgi:hypothetical protein